MPKTCWRSANRYRAASVTPLWRPPPSPLATNPGSASTRIDGGTFSTATGWRGSKRPTVCGSPPSRPLWAGQRPPSGGCGKRASSSAPLGNVWWLRLVDGCLCEAVRAQDRPREFLRLADAFAASVRLTDRGTLIERQLLLARAQLIRGAAADAEPAARRALKLLEPTDLLTQHANASLMLADALEARGLVADAAAARGEAIAKLRAKGNLAAVAHLGG